MDLSPMFFSRADLLVVVVEVVVVDHQRRLKLQQVDGNHVVVVGVSCMFQDRVVELSFLITYVDEFCLITLSEK